MKYRVLSGRLDWPKGSVVDAADLSGNIDLLVQAGHIEPAADSPKTKTKPVVPDFDAADQPEEHE